MLAPQSDSEIRPFVDAIQAIDRLLDVSVDTTIFDGAVVYTRAD